MHADIHMHTQTNKKITNKRDEHTKSISMSQSVVRDKQFFWEVLKTGTTIRFKWVTNGILIRVLRDMMLLNTFDLLLIQYVPLTAMNF